MLKFKNQYILLVWHLFPTSRWSQGWRAGRDFDGLLWNIWGFPCWNNCNEGMKLITKKLLIFIRILAISVWTGRILICFIQAFFVFCFSSQIRPWNQKLLSGDNSISDFIRDSNLNFSYLSYSVVQGILWLLYHCLSIHLTVQLLPARKRAEVLYFQQFIILCAI